MLEKKNNLIFTSLKQNPIDLIWVSNREDAPKTEIKKHIKKVFWHQCFNKN